MEHQSILTIYLIFVSLITGMYAFFGAYIARAVERELLKNIVLAFFFISSAIWCLDGYERANFLINGYLENNSISKVLFNELLTSIGLWKLVFPAILAGFGISQVNEIIRRYVEPVRS